MKKSSASGMATYTIPISVDPMLAIGVGLLRYSSQMNITGMSIMI